MAEKVRHVRRRRRTKTSRTRLGLSWKQFGTLVGATAIGFSLGLVCLIYGPRAYTTWRESRLLQQATEMLQKDRFEEAIRAAHDALEIQPVSLPAYYILAEATEKQNRAETVAWRSQIARLLPHDLESQLNLASAALRFGQLDTARAALQNVAPADRERAAYHVVAGWLARAEGNDAEVENHFRAAVKQEPTNDLYQFNLAVLQIHSPDDIKNADARETLDRLSKIPVFRTGAVRALLSDAVEREDFEAADRLAQNLQMSQQVTFSDYLLCLDFYRKLDQKKFTAVLDKIKPVAARNPEDLALLLDWMNRNRLANEVLRWIEKLPAAATANPPTAISVAEAFAAIKNWSRLKRWTRSGSWGEFDYLRLAYQAYAARQVRQSSADAEFESLWHSAEHEANEGSDRLLQLARLASKWSFAGEAAQLWQRVAKNPPTRREALDALYGIYRANNDLPNLYQTAQRLHETSPGEPEPTAEAARLGLLLDQNPAEGHRLAKEAYEAAPDNVRCVTSYAFSLYVLARTAEGVALMRKLPSDALHDPHVAAYMATLLVDDNELDAAKEFIATAESGSVFPEEKKLLEEAVEKVKRAETPLPTPPPVAPEEITSPSPAPSASPPG